jgi:hypothetical protein
VALVVPAHVAPAQVLDGGGLACASLPKEEKDGISLAYVRCLIFRGLQQSEELLEVEEYNAIEGGIKHLESLAYRVILQFVTLLDQSHDFSPI